MNRKIVIDVPGETKARWVKAAQSKGQTLVDFIASAVEPEVIRRLSPDGWTAEMDALLGTGADDVVAAAIGKTRHKVMRRRQALGIDAAMKRGRPAKAKD